MNVQWRVSSLNSIEVVDRRGENMCVRCIIKLLPVPEVISLICVALLFYGEGWFLSSEKMC